MSRQPMQSLFYSDDNDSDLESDDDSLCEPIISNWLDEEEPSVEFIPSSPTTSRLELTKNQRKSRGSRPLPTHPFLASNLDLFYSLCLVEDLDFAVRSEDQQVQLCQTIIIEEFKPGQNVFEAGDSSTDFYIIVSSDAQIDSTRVAVLGRSSEGNEVLITHLHRGQFFGQMYFLTRQPRVRSATIHIPRQSNSDLMSDSSTVRLARVSSIHFDLWSCFRTALIFSMVPLMQVLPRATRSELLAQMSIEHFKKGECIIQQGTPGDRFYIVLDGYVQVVEAESIAAEHADQTNPQPILRPLVTLREGHCFGEMSLITNEPRVASVYSDSAVTLLSLTKATFQSALSAAEFNDVVSELAASHNRARQGRHVEKLRLGLLRRDSEGSIKGAGDESSDIMKNETNAGAAEGHFGIGNDTEIDFSSTGIRNPYDKNDKEHDGSPRPCTNFFSAHSNLPPVTITRHLSIKKSRKNDSSVLAAPLTPARADGSKPVQGFELGVDVGIGSSKSTRIVNEKYEILKEIGRGSYGEVYLAREVGQIGPRGGLDTRYWAIKAFSRDSTVDYTRVRSSHTKSYGSMNTNNHSSNHADSNNLSGSHSITPGIIRSNSTVSSDYSLSSQTFREVQILQMLRHRNIVYLHEVIDDPLSRKVYLVQEYLVGGVVLPDRETADRLPASFARRCFRDLIRGVHYLHAQGIIHRDIKPQNLMLHRYDKHSIPVLKIIDFGAAVYVKGLTASSSGSLSNIPSLNSGVFRVDYNLSSQHGSGQNTGTSHTGTSHTGTPHTGTPHSNTPSTPHTTSPSTHSADQSSSHQGNDLAGIHPHSRSFYGGTPAFMAPELFSVKASVLTSINQTCATTVDSGSTTTSTPDQSAGRHPSVDIFAMGATLFFLVAGHPPWMANSQLNLAAKIKGLEPPLPISVDPHLKYLLKRLLNKDRSSRISMSELYVDPWVTMEGSEPIDENGDGPDSASDWAAFHETLQKAPSSPELPYSPLGKSVSLPIRSRLDHTEEQTETDFSSTGIRNPYDKNDREHDFSSRSPLHEYLSAPSPQSSPLDQFLALPPITTSSAASPPTSPPQQDFLYPRSLARTKDFYLSPAPLDGFYDGGVKLQSDGGSMGSTGMEGTDLQSMQAAIQPPGTLTQYTGTNTDTWMALQSLGGIDLGLMERRRRRERAILFSQQSRQIIKQDSCSSLLSAGTSSSKGSANLWSTGIGGTGMGGTEELSDTPYTESMHIDSAHAFKEDQDQDDDRASSDSSNDSKYEEELLQDDEFDEMLNSLAATKIRPAHSRKALWNCIIKDSTPTPHHNSKRRPSRMSSNTNRSGIEKRTGSDKSKSSIRNSDENHDSDSTPTSGTTPTTSTHSMKTLMSDGGKYSYSNQRGSKRSLCSHNSSPSLQLDFDIDDPVYSVMNKVHSKPDTTVHSLGVKWGSSCAQGSRGDMEDRHVCTKINICDNKQSVQTLKNAMPSKSLAALASMQSCLLPPLPPVVESSGQAVLMGVFDGHNGSLVAEILHKRWPVLIKSAVLEVIDMTSITSSMHNVDNSAPSIDPEGPSGPTLPTALIALHSKIEKLCSTMDREILAAELSRLLMKQRSSIRISSSSPDLKSLSNSFHGSASNPNLVSLGTSTGISSTAPSQELSPMTMPATDSISRLLKNKHHTTCSGSTAALVLIVEGVHLGIETDTESEKNPSGMRNPYDKNDRVLENSNNYAIITHVGDTRVVLCTAGIAYQLTNDHRPTLSSEADRIVLAGGIVVNHRVGGVLGVTRCFGDLPYKIFTGPMAAAGCPAEADGGEKQLQWGLWGVDKQVISKPDITTHHLRHRDEFFIIATDGLWDVMECQEAVNFVRWQLYEHADVDKAASALVREVVGRSSGGDNVTVVICCVNQI